MAAGGLNVGRYRWSCGSNNDFNLFEEMDLAAKLQKLTTMDPRALPARTVVAMATINGAKALGMEKEILIARSRQTRGSDFHARLDRAHAVPLYDVYSHLAYAIKASDVTDVLINGKVIVRDGKCLTIDGAVTRAKAREYGWKIAESVK